MKKYKFKTRYKEFLEKQLEGLKLHSDNYEVDLDAEHKKNNSTYNKSKYLPITQEEINDIHKRGKITQAEKVEEFMSLGVCVPGDNIGSASRRCHRFNYKCRDCLIDYTSGQKEFYSSFKNPKENPSKKRSLTK